MEDPVPTLALPAYAQGDGKEITVNTLDYCYVSCMVSLLLSGEIRSSMNLRTIMLSLSLALALTTVFLLGITLLSLRMKKSK